jgi:hypothetical protein
MGVLIVTLAVARPDGATLAGAARLLPDVVRLVRRLAGDRALPDRYAGGPGRGPPPRRPSYTRRHG